MDNMEQMAWMSRVVRIMGITLDDIMSSRLEIFLFLATLWRRQHPIM